MKLKEKSLHRQAEEYTELLERSAERLPCTTTPVYDGFC